MFKEKYHSMNKQISPDKELVNKIIHSIDDTKIKTNKAKIYLRKPITIFAILIVLIFTVTPILAANVPAVYQLMYFVT